MSSRRQNNPRKTGKLFRQKTASQQQTSHSFILTATSKRMFFTFIKTGAVLFSYLALVEQALSLTLSVIASSDSTAFKIETWCRYCQGKRAIVSAIKPPRNDRRTTMNQ
jgi:hypothetical protein